MADIRLMPTLATMADVYRLPREGGSASPRFRRYLELVTNNLSLAAYNPMAGPHALETTGQLLAIDAEAVAAEAARETADLCGYADTIAMAVVVCSPGTWTDRLSTEVEHRTTRRVPGTGLVLHWTREIPTVEQIRREAIAETVRVMLVTGDRPESVRRLVLREGVAYALGGNPYGPATDEDRQAVAEALEVLGDSAALGDMTAILYGDAAAATLGWASAGIADYGGYRWAVDRARQRIEALGAPSALLAAEERTWTTSR